jgi:hypothetical protein
LGVVSIITSDSTYVRRDFGLQQGLLRAVRLPNRSLFDSIRD